MSYFQVLWRNYPSNDPCDAKDKNGGVLFKNQCAIRLGYALKKSGVSLLSFPQGRKCWVHKGCDHILAAKELADWLDKGMVPRRGKLMKKIIIFIAGLVVGAIACFALLYASGFVFERLGILLYESEADQQRNFNIFVVVSMVISVGVGWLFVKKYPEISGAGETVLVTVGQCEVKK